MVEYVLVLSSFATSEIVPDKPAETKLATKLSSESFGRKRRSEKYDESVEGVLVWQIRHVSNRKHGDYSRRDTIYTVRTPISRANIRLCNLNVNTRADY